MNCLQCGRANLREKRATLPGKIKGERFKVTMPGLVCPVCGYTTVELKDMAEYMRLVADAYRSKHGLLTSDEIRERRKAQGMNQNQFAKHLGVGVASVKRWELGKVQDRSSDNLVRLQTDKPTARTPIQEAQADVSRQLSFVRLIQSYGRTMSEPRKKQKWSSKKPLSYKQ